MRKQISPDPMKGQELNLDRRRSDDSKKRKIPRSKYNRAVLDELAKKWVRFGCCDTPNEAMKLLLGGDN